MGQGRGNVDMWMGYGNTRGYTYMDVVWEYVGLWLQGCGMGICGYTAMGPGPSGPALLPKTGLQKHLNCPG